MLRIYQAISCLYTAKWLHLYRKSAPRIVQTEKQMVSSMKVQIPRSEEVNYVLSHLSLQTWPLFSLLWSHTTSYRCYTPINFTKDLQIRVRIKEWSIDEEPLNIAWENSKNATLFLMKRERLHIESEISYTVPVNLPSDANSLRLVLKLLVVQAPTSAWFWNMHYKAVWANIIKREAWTLFGLEVCREQIGLWNNFKCFCYDHCDFRLLCLVGVTICVCERSAVGYWDGNDTSRTYIWDYANLSPVWRFSFGIRGKHACCFTTTDDVGENMWKKICLPIFRKSVEMRNKGTLDILDILDACETLGM